VLERDDLAAGTVLVRGVLENAAVLWRGYEKSGGTTPRTAEIT
jgi:hypothetical protein